MMATNKDQYTHHIILYDKYYICKVGNDLSVRQYLLLVVPHLPTLINEHKNESNKWGIQLIMQICFIDPNER